ncbi:MAG: glucodextranase DOMON-like domain-containing protein [Solirubrobacteraceae bacterium]
MIRRVQLVLAVCALGASLVLTSGASAAVSATTAPGPPGAQSYFDLARKDCVGTARNTRSKVWFTVADGVLSDVYWPTVDATNVHTLQYLVSDGHSFTDLQTRDMTYTLVPDPTGMSCTVVATNTAHGYRITTTYAADPARAAILMHTEFAGPAGDRLYVRLDPLAGGTGGGGPSNAGANTATVARAGGQPVLVASNPNTTTDAVNRSYAVPTFEALQSSHGFSSASVGYAGSASDGLSMLDANHQLTPYTSAPDGHVTLTAGVTLSSGHSVDLALGFGSTESTATAVAGASLAQPFGPVLAAYERQWLTYDSGLRPPSLQLGRAAVQEYYESLNVVKASEDKTFPGAIAAGLASPWGQSVPAGNDTNGLPTYFGSYREVFARDLYEAFTSLLVAGDLRTAQAATLFLFDRQQLADGSIPRNSLLNGMAAPDTGGLQLDETSYPILMAWQSGLARRGDLYVKHVIPAADFLVAHGPSDGVERWEEQTGYSPSTIAAEIAGLTAAAKIAAANGDPARATLYHATADEFARNIKNWTVTTTGPDAPRYFIRLSKTGDPNAAISYSLGNGSLTVDQREVVDAGFLDLVRLGVLPADDPDVLASVGVLDKQIEVQTPSGPGYYRYGTSAAAGSADGYGDCYQPSQTSCTVTGAPWPPTDIGTGHLWPVLSGERGEYDLADGDRSAALGLLSAMRSMTSGQGLEPEQVWEDPDLAASPYGSDPATASIGFNDGQPAGSASPLTWAQAQYARLALDLSAGRSLETPAIVTRRYVTHGMPGTLPLSVTSPAPGASINSDTVAVSGTTSPGANVVAQGAGTSGTTGTTSTTADASGNWSLSVPGNFGSTTIIVTAALGASTGYDQFSVTDFFIPGTSVLTVTDPAGDDNGPGTYVYPTAADFHPGAFDLTGAQVKQTTSDVYVSVTLANLDDTFGAPFGAQLLDVYAHDPAASNTSTRAAYPSRNYTLAPAGAWSELVEAQGFAPVSWVDPAGNSLGSAQLVIDHANRTATIVVPRASFGTVGPGWAFTVTLAGQDGFSSDRARAFAATPQPYAFGVCAAGGTSPICALDPATVPKVLDTITPPGVSQATELDPTRGAVALQPVAVP